MVHQHPFNAENVRNIIPDLNFNHTFMVQCKTITCKKLELTDVALHFLFNTGGEICAAKHQYIIACFKTCPTEREENQEGERRRKVQSYSGT
jgi:hypothetical protein